jgi:NTP pyrophosphatase (non-canonical NTP hydrolase)
MQTISFNEYQRLSTRTANKDLSYKEKLSNYALGLAGESGEVCDYIKKALYHGHPLDVEFIKKELGDNLWYISQMAETVGLTLEEIAIANIEKLKKRYPDGFSAKNSLNRKED